MKRKTRRQGNAETRRSLRVSAPRCLRVLFVALFVASSAIQFTPSLRAQTRQRPGAHSSASRENFTAADRRLVEKAIGATCTERVRDPLGSMPIDEMQGRPSLPVNNPDAVAGAHRAERLLPTTKTLLAKVILKLAKEYDLYGTSAASATVSADTYPLADTTRIQAERA